MAFFSASWGLELQGFASGGGVRVARSPAESGLKKNPGHKINEFPKPILRNFDHISESKKTRVHTWPYPQNEMAIFIPESKI